MAEYGLNALKQIGLGESDLVRGTPCILGDFDGNGSEDAAFLGVGGLEEAAFDAGPSALEVRVLLLDSRGLLGVFRLPKRVTSLALHRLPATDGGSLRVADGLAEPSASKRFHFRFDGHGFVLETH